ncbi:hypothetical protein PRIPAC_81552 [Pristionchus pacificus]|uniref:Elongation of very long chain fatty acids protein n=1 Tax=Pristionchus pacificus TaxID=54126 RepID=A0A2A6C4J9_PRIPA|nr:hypothetical protein PRIPAC_81552 [Pristionchus pacificus]|eukprot:PDM72951.1 hypothetical protein PRIPAC_39385 [Pristionchus pacificus]
MDSLRSFYESLTTFEISEYNYTEVTSSYKYKFSLPIERFEGTREVTRFLQNYWQHTITVSVAYYLLIKSIQWSMKNRPALNLRLPLIIWNLSLAIFSVCGFLRFGEDFVMSLSIRGIYTTFCTNPPTRGVAPFWCLLFLISKLVEMGDTLFIVLRKRPLIFLHYYHHVVVLIYTAHSGAEHATPGRAFIAMNYAAHSLMYSYYAARAMGFKPSEKVSVSITVCQTIQMIVGVAISVWTFFVKTYLGWKCQQSYPNLYMGFFIYFTFAFLFIQFFVNRYLKAKRKAEIIEMEKKKE